jgi:hypothetical protein
MRKYICCTLSRYHHAAVCVPAERAIFVFGGILEHSGVSQELWKYSLEDDLWLRVSVRPLFCYTLSKAWHLSIESCCIFFSMPKILPACDVEHSVMERQNSMKRKC